jgi:hypothetical protein
MIPDTNVIRLEMARNISLFHVWSKTMCAISSIERQMVIAMANFTA